MDLDDILLEIFRHLAESLSPNLEPGWIPKLTKNATQSQSETPLPVEEGNFLLTDSNRMQENDILVPVVNGHDNGIPLPTRIDLNYFGNDNDGDEANAMDEADEVEEANLEHQSEDEESNEVIDVGGDNPAWLQALLGVTRHEPPEDDFDLHYGRIHFRALLHQARILTQVCRQWRTIAHRVPELWRFVAGLDNIVTSSFTTAWSNEFLPLCPIPIPSRVIFFQCCILGSQTDFDPNLHSLGRYTDHDEINNRMMSGVGITSIKPSDSKPLDPLLLPVDNATRHQLVRVAEGGLFVDRSDCVGLLYHLDEPFENQSRFPAFAVQWQRYIGSPSEDAFYLAIDRDSDGNLTVASNPAVACGFNFIMEPDWEKLASF